MYKYGLEILPRTFHCKSSEIIYTATVGNSSLYIVHTHKCDLNILQKPFRAYLSPVLKTSQLRMVWPPDPGGFNLEPAFN